MFSINRLYIVLRPLNGLEFYVFLCKHRISFWKYVDNPNTFSIFLFDCIQWSFQEYHQFPFIMFNIYGLSFIQYRLYLPKSRCLVNWLKKQIKVYRKWSKRFFCTKLYITNGVKCKDEFWKWFVFIKKHFVFKTVKDTSY